MFKTVLVISVFCAVYAGYAEQLSRVAPVDTAPVVLFNPHDIPQALHPLFFEGSYQQRCRLAKGLKDNLTEAEIDALLTFIIATPEEVGLSRDHFNSVGDKVINALEAQESIPPALIDQLIVMFNETSGHFTWRDYCVQHLGSLYASEAAAGKRVAMMATFEKALDVETHVAGTAILALQKNIGAESITKQLVNAEAKRVALDENQDEASRLTSMLVAAELGNRDMLPMARGIIDSREPVQFRMAAMATLGMLGDSSDLSQLEKHTSSPDMRLRTASRSAIKKINAR